MRGEKPIQTAKVRRSASPAHPEKVDDEPITRVVFDRKFLPSGRSATDDVVRSTILAGRSGIMPSFDGSLSDEDIQDIILYLHTSKASPQAATPAP